MSDDGKVVQILAGSDPSCLYAAGYRQLAGGYWQRRRGKVLRRVIRQPDGSWAVFESEVAR